MVATAALGHKLRIHLTPSAVRHENRKRWNKKGKRDFFASAVVANYAFVFSLLASVQCLFPLPENRKKGVRARPFNLR